MAIGVTATIAYESGSDFVVIPKIRKFSLPSIAVTSIDTTNTNITDGFKTSSSGMIDPGMVTVECEFTESLYGTLKGFLRQQKNWQVTGPDDEPVVCTFAADITKLEVGVEPDAIMVITLELKVSGAIS